MQVEFVFLNPSYNEAEIDWDTALLKVNRQVRTEMLTLYIELITTLTKDNVRIPTLNQDNWKHCVTMLFTVHKPELSRLNSTIGLPRPVFQMLTNNSWVVRLVDSIPGSARGSLCLIWWNPPLVEDRS